MHPHSAASRPPRPAPRTSAGPLPAQLRAGEIRAGRRPRGPRAFAPFIRSLCLLSPPVPSPRPPRAPDPGTPREGSNAPAALAERDSGLDLSVKVDLTLGTTAWQKLCSRQGPPSRSPPFSCAVSLSAQGPCARRAPLSRCSPPAASAPEPSRRPPPRGLRLTWEQKWPM